MSRYKIVPQGTVLKKTFFKLPFQYHRVYTSAPKRPKTTKQDTYVEVTPKTTATKVRYILPTIKIDELDNWWFYWMTYRKRIK